jgi:hypothetical protein
MSVSAQQARMRQSLLKLNPFAPRQQARVPVCSVGNRDNAKLNTVSLSLSPRQHKQFVRELVRSGEEFVLVWT